MRKPIIAVALALLLVASGTARADLPRDTQDAMQFERYGLIRDKKTGAVVKDLGKNKAGPFNGKSQCLEGILGDKVVVDIWLKAQRVDPKNFKAEFTCRPAGHEI